MGHELCPSKTPSDARAECLTLEKGELSGLLNLEHRKLTEQLMGHFILEYQDGLGWKGPDRSSPSTPPAVDRDRGPTQLHFQRDHLDSRAFKDDKSAPERSQQLWEQLWARPAQGRTAGCGNCPTTVWTIPSQPRQSAL